MGVGQAMKDALDAQYERGRGAGLREALLILDMEISLGIPGRAVLLDKLMQKIEARLRVTARQELEDAR